MDAPLFNWLDRRSAGLLLHPTALPGGQGIGTLGADARRLIDFLEAAKLRYWQICPLGPTGFGHSPYQCFSAFAGNPWLIDLEELVSFGLLQDDELQPLRALPTGTVDYDAIGSLKPELLRLAHQRFVEQGDDTLGEYGSFERWREENDSWLAPYTLYMALKEWFEGAAWQQWPARYFSYLKAVSTPFRTELAGAVDKQAFYQYLFFSQWERLHSYAGERGIGIIGDAPIYVAVDSADTWANPWLFDLDREGQPGHVAGVPPDYFSETGQMWGNPIYDWKALEESGYEWWLRRLAMNFELFDVVRLDHFRGFEAFWRIPAGDEDARGGEWVPGPGLSFFKAVSERFPGARIIAEDLGEITPELLEFTRATGLPGMAVLQFAFTGEPDNLYLPCNLSRNTVVYPGTHDNDTSHGWWQSLESEEIRDQLRRYLRVSGDDIAWDLVRAAYSSSGRLAIFTLQDLLSLGSDARFNTPGTVAGNWAWRCRKSQLDRLERQSARDLSELAWLFNRGWPAMEIPESDETD
jgi:4-alpha-glucanotransferase